MGMHCLKDTEVDFRVMFDIEIYGTHAEGMSGGLLT